MRVLTAILLLIALATGSCRTADGQDLLDNKVVPLVDDHQHLLSPAGAALQNAYSLRERLPYDVEQPVVGEHLVAMLDRAGIKRAVVLSDAYWFDSPPRARTLRDIEVHDVYAAVRAVRARTPRELPSHADFRSSIALAAVGLGSSAGPRRGAPDGTRRQSRSTLR